MRVIKKILPGANGSKRFVEKFGTDLLCVRYRIDDAQNTRYTTVEIIVDQTKYQQIMPEIRQLYPTANQLVYVKISMGQTALRKLAIEKGAKWINAKRLWQMPRKIAKELGLEKQIKSE